MRSSYVMTSADIVARYGYPDRKPGPPAYACAYDLGCNGPDCEASDCPRKRKVLLEGTDE